MKNPFDPNKQAGYWNTWESGHDAGLREGARRERRALRKFIDHYCEEFFGDLRHALEDYTDAQAPLASRKRKGGKK